MKYLQYIYCTDNGLEYKVICLIKINEVLNKKCDEQVQL